MVTIGRFTKPEDAHLVRTRLAAGGVESFLRDEHTVQMYWLYSDAMGGVRLQVLDQDAARAREILAEPAEELSDEDRPACPECGAEDVVHDETTRRVSFLSVLLFEIPLPVAKWRMRCRRCGHRWTAPPGEEARGIEQISEVTPQPPSK